MQSESVTPSPTGPTASLPPVNPPTGKFIVQLFLVPGLIVGLIIGLLLLVYWLFGGPRSPESFLKRLDDPNPEVRWRAAADLSQILPRDPHLAANPDFSLKLSAKLDRALRDSAADEKIFLERLPKLDEKEAAPQRKKLQPERDYIQFLTGSLGYFLVPTGAPMLSRVVEQEGVLELQAQTFRRRTALESLANLAENLRRFDRLHSIEQNLILEQLRKLVDSTQGEQREWAEKALACLEKRKAGQFTTMGVDQALIKAAGAEDPVTRYLAAYTLGFWQGDAEQNRGMEETLERLTSDNGRGMERLKEFQGPEPGKTHEWLRQPGLLVQINATMSLLRRGSARVRAGKVAEMLDPKQLAEDIQIEDENGRRTPDESKGVMTVVGTLRALAEYYRHQSGGSLPGIPERIKELTGSSNASIQMAARDASRALAAARAEK